MSGPDSDDFDQRLYVMHQEQLDKMRSERDAAILRERHHHNTSLGWTERAKNAENEIAEAIAEWIETVHKRHDLASEIRAKAWRG